MTTHFPDTTEATELLRRAACETPAGGQHTGGVDLHLAPLNYWLPGELAGHPLFFDRLELPREGDLAP